MDYEGELLSAVPVASDGRDLQGVLSIVVELIGKAKSLIASNPEDVEKIITAVMKVYREVIVPIDLPGVGPILESIIDSQGGNLLEAGLRKFFSQVTA